MANNFVTNPGGSGPKPPAPPSFTSPPAGMDKQKPYDGLETDPKSVTPGGRTASETSANTPSKDAGNPIGVGSLANSSKPFKLNG